MLATKFFNFNAASMGLNFSAAKYNSAKVIFYNSNDLAHIIFQQDYGEVAEKTVVPILQRKSQRSNINSLNLLPNVPRVNTPGILKKEKIKDITSMFDCMPNEHVVFYKTVLTLN